MDKGRVYPDQQEVIETVYCYTFKCGHNKGEGKCNITRVDTKMISVGSEGHCESYFSVEPQKLQTTDQRAGV